MENVVNPHRVLVRDYLWVTRRIHELTEDRSRENREVAENLVCQGL